MTEKKENIVPVAMRREDLVEFPHHELPPGYAFRRYRGGDEQVWTDIWKRSDRYGVIDPSVFRREFGTDEAVLAERQYFMLAPDGVEIGTVTAWLPDDTHGPSSGRVHWVAIVPEMQGKGLGKPLITTVLTRLRELGYARANLHTESVRTVAIRLYLKFGFRPEVRSETERQAWRDLRQLFAPSPLGDFDLGRG